MGDLTHPQERDTSSAAQIFSFLVCFCYCCCWLFFLSSGKKKIGIFDSLFHQFSPLHISASSPLPQTVHGRRNKSTGQWLRKRSSAGHGATNVKLQHLNWGRRSRWSQGHAVAHLVTENAAFCPPCQFLNVLENYHSLHLYILAHIHRFYALFPEQGGIYCLDSCV